MHVSFFLLKVRGKFKVKIIGSSIFVSWSYWSNDLTVEMDIITCFVVSFQRYS